MRSPPGVGPVGLQMQELGHDGPKQGSPCRPAPFKVDSGTYRGNREIGAAESDLAMPLHGRPQRPSSRRSLHKAFYTPVTSR